MSISHIFFNSWNPIFVSAFYGVVRKNQFIRFDTFCRPSLHFRKALLRERIIMATPSSRLLRNNNSFGVSSFCMSLTKYWAPKNPHKPKNIRLITRKTVDLLFMGWLVMRLFKKYLYRHSEFISESVIDQLQAIYRYWIKFNIFFFQQF